MFGGSMSKVRVYEVARDLNVDQDHLVGVLQSLGFNDVRNRMSKVDADAVERVRRHIENQQRTPEVVEERLSATVVKRRRVGAPTRPSTPTAPVAPPAPEVVETKPAAAPVRRRKAADKAKAAPTVVEPPVVADEPVPTAEEPTPVVTPDAEPRVEVEASAEPAREPAGTTEPTLVHAPEPAASAIESPVDAAVAAWLAGESLEGGAPAKPSNDVAVAGPDAPQETPGPAVEAPVEVSTSAVSEGPNEVPADVTAPATPAHVEPEGEMQVPAVSQDGPVELVPVAEQAEPMAQPVARVDEPSSAELEGGDQVTDVDVEEESSVTTRVPVEAPTRIPARPASPTRVAPPVPQPPVRPQQQRTGIDVWEGRPGVPMRQPPQPRPTTPGSPVRRREYDPRANAAAKPDPRAAGNRRPWAGRGKRGAAAAMPMRKTAAPSTKEMSEHKKIIKIEAQVSLQALAGRMSLKATEVLMKLLSMGMPGVNINSTLDADTAKLVASEFGWEVEDVAVSEEDALNMARDETDEDQASLELRPPIVTVMGHVDHGKTSLLDQIRRTNVVAAEAGGITQHIGAYRVNTSRGYITFLDTPGHAAFTQMRLRGAQVTDIVILVVAADDGVMPQTREAISHARAAQVPIIVAVNKIDKEGANPERIRREMSDLGLVPEEWGGETIFCDVSAKSREGLDALLEMTALQAELLELRANPKKPAIGNVIEALLDRGKGPVARVVITDGTLSTGDVILAGTSWGKVRAMTDDRGRMVRSAGPSMPVEILGLSEVPSAGDPIHVVKGVKIAQDLAQQRRTKVSSSLIPASAKVSLEDLTKRIAEADLLELRIIIKADVQGSVEAVADALANLSTDKVRVAIIHAGVGGITEGDVNLAVASRAIIVGFNVRPAGKAGQLAESEGIEIRLYSVIYNAIDDVKSAMLGLIGPSYEERLLGKAEVRQTFHIAKIGTVAGCFVQEGTMRRNAKLRLVRDSVQIFEGRFASLKRFKDDAREVDKGFECGLSIDGYNDIKVGDIVECFEVAEVQASL
jgi:translation initiation factor IF-2